MAAGGRMEDGSLDFTQSVDDDPLLDIQHLPHALYAHFKPRFQPLPTLIIANLLLFIHLVSLSLIYGVNCGTPSVPFVKSYNYIQKVWCVYIYMPLIIIYMRRLPPFLSKKVVFVILAFLTGVLCSYPNPNEDKCPGNYTNPLKVQTVIILGKVILWILHFLLERYIQYHHSKVRKRGYNMIYQSTRNLKRLALTIHSTGNTALLFTLCMQHSFPQAGRLYLDLILAILTLELIGSLTCLLIYTVKIRKFNKARPQPDVLEEEKTYAYPSTTTSETGFRTVSSLEEIVEKQGDIILYLKRHNALLSKRLLALTSTDLGSQPGRT